MFGKLDLGSLNKGMKRSGNDVSSTLLPLFYTNCMVQNALKAIQTDPIMTTMPPILVIK